MMIIIILSQLKFNSIRYFFYSSAAKTLHINNKVWWNLLQLDTFFISCFFFFLHTTVLNCNKSMGDKSHTFIYYLTSRTSRIDFCLQAIFECWCFPSAILTINFCHIHFRLCGISFNSLAGAMIYFIDITFESGCLWMGKQFR